MRIAILSDIHSNFPAFEAVLLHILTNGGADYFWSLGDVVGYGPYPNECMETLKQLPHVSLPGNHDYGVIHQQLLEEFNTDARRACMWTRTQLTQQNLNYLEALPELRRLVRAESGDFVEVSSHDNADVTLVHASPRDPIWEYVLETQQAAANFSLLDTQFCFIGHSHIPLIFAEVIAGDPDGPGERQPATRISMARPEADDVLELNGERLIINPGSVGQPRDGDPRAAYALYDTGTNTIAFYRVEYDITRTQQAILNAGLPVRLATRLAYGM